MSHAPTRTLEDRHDQVRQLLAANSLDVLVVTALSNVRYLTNFTGSSAMAVLSRERCHLITDFRYRTAIEVVQSTGSACPNLTLHIAPGAPDVELAGLLGSMSGTRVGFEAAHLTVARHRWLLATLAAGGGQQPTLKATEGLVESCRVRKDEYEIATMREAARRLSQAAAAVLAEIHGGMSERGVARLVETQLYAVGFEKPAFDTIVASGPNGALPHAQPGERILSEGDLVVLDFGGVYDSYCVDLTRTIAIGRATSRAREVHRAVLEAHDRAIAAVRPGQSRFDIDAAARDVLTARGLAEAFGHATGHGLGLDIHEDPKITRRRADVRGDNEPVEPGMVFTIEPGAYLAGWGGVRIEDDVLVTADGVEVLTNVGTDLLEMGT
jgi:Xaa-Pro aminopeptidase